MTCPYCTADGRDSCPIHYHYRRDPMLAGVIFAVVVVFATLISIVLHGAMQ